MQRRDTNGNNKIIQKETSHNKETRRQKDPRQENRAKQD
jgi:hypothetical protein